MERRFWCNSNSRIPSGPDRVNHRWGTGMGVVVVEGVLKTADKRAPEAQQSTTGSNSEVDDVNSSRFEEGCFSVFWTGSCFQYNVRVS